MRPGFVESEKFLVLFYVGNKCVHFLAPKFHEEKAIYFNAPRIEAMEGLDDSGIVHIFVRNNDNTVSKSCQFKYIR